MGSGSVGAGKSENPGPGQELRLGENQTSRNVNIEPNTVHQSVGHERQIAQKGFVTAEAHRRRWSSCRGSYEGGKGRCSVLSGYNYWMTVLQPLPQPHNQM